MRKRLFVHHLTNIYWCFLYAGHYARVRDLLVRKTDQSMLSWYYSRAHQDSDINWIILITIHGLLTACVLLYRSFLASGLHPTDGSCFTYLWLHAYPFFSNSRPNRASTGLILPLASRSQPHRAQFPFWRQLFFSRQPRLFLPLGVWHCPSLFPKDKHIGTQPNSPRPVTQKQDCGGCHFTILHLKSFLLKKTISIDMILQKNNTVDQV